MTYIDEVKEALESLITVGNGERIEGIEDVPVLETTGVTMDQLLLIVQAAWDFVESKKPSILIEVEGNLTPQDMQFLKTKYHWNDVTHTDRCNINVLGAEPLTVGGDCTCGAVEYYQG